MADEVDNALAFDETEAEYEERRYGVTDTHTVKFHGKVREQLQADIEYFLLSGGCIDQLPSYVTGKHSGMSIG